jgi:dipeptide transport system substrate-binding protein
VLVRNERFWDVNSIQPDEIQIKIIDDPKIAFDLYQLGKLDVIGEPLSEIPFGVLRNKQLYNIYTKDVTAIQWYTLNCQKPPFISDKCRRAISLAIDRNRLAAEVLAGFEKPSRSLLAHTLSAIHDIPLAHDILAARELFQAGLLEQGLTTAPPIKIRIYNQEPYRAIAEEVALMLYAVFAMEVSVETVSWETFFNELPKREHDILGITWYSWYQDPLYTFEIFTNPGHEMNSAGWTDSTYQELVHELREDVTNLELRKKIELYLLKKMPVVPLVDHTFRYMKHSQIDNILFSHLGNIDFRWAKLYNS